MSQKTEVSEDFKSPDGTTTWSADKEGLSFEVKNSFVTVTSSLSWAWIEAAARKLTDAVKAESSSIQK